VKTSATEEKIDFEGGAGGVDKGCVVEGEGGESANVGDFGVSSTRGDSTVKVLLPTSEEGVGRSEMLSFSISASGLDNDAPPIPSIDVEVATS